LHILPITHHPEETFMFTKDWKKEILTIPNLLSLFRLLLIPVYVLIYLNASVPAHYYIAGGILAASCLTDLIDGKIARHFNMVTNLGKILDPLADKATQITLIVCLAIRYRILWLILGLFVLKEGFQVVAGILTLRQGKMLTGALFSGKLCTVVLFLSLILLVLFPQLQSKAVIIIAAVDGFFMLIAFANYIRTYCQCTGMIQKLDPEDA
jgi:cardiolipin synthase